MASRISSFIHRFSARMTPPSTQPDGEEKPVPVEIRRAFSPFEIIQSVWGSVFQFVVTASVVVVFVIFILLQREDLRDRVLRMAGRNLIRLTTEALDDAARRVSRFLMAQLALNFMFGVLATVGLLLLLLVQ